MSQQRQSCLWGPRPEASSAWPQAAAAVLTASQLGMAVSGPEKRQVCSELHARKGGPATTRSSPCSNAGGESQPNEASLQELNQRRTDCYWALVEGLLPTSVGAESAAGSRYSSKAQPESLSEEEVGGRPACVPLQGGTSLWGHAGLGRDMSRRRELMNSRARRKRPVNEREYLEWLVALHRGDSGLLEALAI